MINEDDLMTYRAGDDVGAEIINLKVKLRKHEDAARELINRLKSIRVLDSWSKQWSVVEAAISAFELKTEIQSLLP